MFALMVIIAVVVWIEATTDLAKSADVYKPKQPTRLTLFESSIVEFTLFAFIVYTILNWI